jgi:hypothetical protein
MTEILLTVSKRWLSASRELAEPFRLREDPRMELIAAVTLWGLFSAWLLFPQLGVPRMLRLAVAWLSWLELVAVLVWAFGSEDCVRRPCGAVAETGRSAAGLDLPLLSVAVLCLAVAYGLRRGRNAGPAPRA